MDRATLISDLRGLAYMSAMPHLRITCGGAAAMLEKDNAVLRDAVNELCRLCGKYAYAHNDSCDGCRWKKVQNGGN